MDGQLALGIGLGIVGISIPLTALVLHASLPRRNQNDVTRDQDRVRDVQLVSAGQAEELAGIKVHLASIDLRLEKIEKKLYGQ